MERRNFLKSFGVALATTATKPVQVESETVVKVKKGRWEQQWTKPKTQEHIQKIANSNRGKKRSLEARKKMSLAKLGKKNGPLSKETKAKIITTKVQKGVTRIVSQFTLQGSLVQTYDSINEAARTVGTTPANIYACLKGKTRHAVGYYWKLK